MRYFTAVVDCGSFTEAAERCYISQSAISQQIQTLEKELGVELLRRENRRFAMTAAGESFYVRSKAILEQADAMVQEVKRLGADRELRLRIGYLRGYSGLELHQAVAEFSGRYPEVAISIVNGTHEELYNLLRLDGADLVFNDQRRAFSDAYVNDELAQCGLWAEVSLHGPLGALDRVDVEELRGMPCILISSREGQSAEQAYYQNTLGFGGSYLFADSLEEGRLLVAGNRGFLPVESVGTLPPEGAAIRRIPICREGKQILRNYCAFWKKERSGYYIEEFARLLRELLQQRQPAF